LTRINEIEELVKRAQKNDADAQKILYEKHIKEMLLLSYRMLSYSDEAKDAVQESFINAFQKLKKLKSEEKFKSWLKRIVINNCLKRLKVRIRNTDFKNNPDFVDEEEDDLYGNISPEIIDEEINKLPTGCKQILTLYLLEDYKHKEIARMLNISESTSKSQYQRALTLLRIKLKTHLA
jgi:RNA polymerase sigma factor (sigma-70 family)